MYLLISLLIKVAAPKDITLILKYSRILIYEFLYNRAFDYRETVKFHDCKVHQKKFCVIIGYALQKV